ncbi:MAG: DUF1566 domain-containing protein [Deltaproteobacteria bacterium]|nr:DUF1566 domain-containing protein [Deltaproteobacteria bacterium]MBW2071048.1 DUF1566 domain-containing protein [Deltaproteobacteria bacterium]
MCRRRVFGVCVLAVLIVSSLSPAIASDRFTDNGDGTVTDHQLQVMWAKHDNQGDIDWRGAERYCKWTFPYTLPVLYDNWRMPTVEELRSLYVADKGYQGYESDCGQKVKVVPEIRLSCGWVWASEPMSVDIELKGRKIRRRSISARVFNFNRGYPYTDLMRHSRAYRALPVRDLQQGK